MQFNKYTHTHTTHGETQRQAIIYLYNIYIYVVVVDSHIQRFVFATEETTVTQQVSHRPIKCQPRLWSQRDTKVNWSNPGDNPLLRHQQGSKSRQKVIRLYKQWHRPMSGSSNFLTPYREQPRSTRIVVAYPRPAFSATKQTILRSNQF